MCHNLESQGFWACHVFSPLKYGVVVLVLPHFCRATVLWLFRIRISYFLVSLACWAYYFSAASPGCVFTLLFIFHNWADHGFVALACCGSALFFRAIVWWVYHCFLAWPYEALQFFGGITTFLWLGSIRRATVFSCHCLVALSCLRLQLLWNSRCYFCRILGFVTVFWLATVGGFSMSRVERMIGSNRSNGDLNGCTVVQLHLEFVSVNTSWDLKRYFESFFSDVRPRNVTENVDLNINFKTVNNFHLRIFVVSRLECSLPIAYPSTRATTDVPSMVRRAPPSVYRPIGLQLVSLPTIAPPGVASMVKRFPPLSNTSHWIHGTSHPTIAVHPIYSHFIGVTYPHVLNWTVFRCSVNVSGYLRAKLDAVEGR